MMRSMLSRSIVLGGMIIVLVLNVLAVTDVAIGSEGNGPCWNCWKVTCEYNGQGQLTKKVCESTSNHDCSCSASTN
jgi:hypothetical protein